MTTYNRFSPNYPITASGSIDVLGDEFPSMHHTPRQQKASPLAADFPDADTSNWSSAPRPTVTAWEGADMDAYWLDGETWRHCQTGATWVRPITLNDIASLICRDVEASTRMEAAE